MTRVRGNVEYAAASTLDGRTVYAALRYVTTAAGAPGFGAGTHLTSQVYPLSASGTAPLAPIDPWR